MSNQTYDIINKVQRWLPSLGVLYLTLANIWGLPLGDAIRDTILAIATFLASILEVSTVAYKQKQLDAADYLADELEDYEEDDPVDGGVG